MIKNKFKKLIIISLTFLFSLVILLIVGLIKPFNNNDIVTQSSIKNQSYNLVNQARINTVKDGEKIYRDTDDEFVSNQVAGYERSNNFNGLKLSNGGYIFISDEDDSVIYRTDYFYNVLWTYKISNVDSIERHVLEVAQDDKDPSTFYLLAAPKNNDDVALAAYSNFDKKGFGVLEKLKENLDRDISKRIDKQAEISIDPQTLLDNIPNTWNNNPDFLKSLIGFSNNGRFVISFNNYLANLANLVVYGGSVYILGGTGNINTQIADRFQSLGIYRINKERFNEIIGWPYAVLIGGWNEQGNNNNNNNNNNNISVNLPIFEDVKYTYVMRAAIAGARIIKDTSHLQLGGSFSIGDENVLTAGKHHEINPVKNNSSDLKAIGSFRLSLNILEGLGKFNSPSTITEDTDLKKLNPDFQLVSHLEDFNFNNFTALETSQQNIKNRSKLAGLDDYYFHNVANFEDGFSFGTFTMQFNDLIVVFGVNQTYDLIETPDSIRQLFGNKTDQYNWNHYVNTINSNDPENQNKVIIWSLHAQSKNKTAALVYVLQYRNNNYIIRSLNTVTQRSGGVTQQIANNSNFGAYPITNAIELDGTKRIVVYYETANTTWKSLSLFEFNINDNLAQLNTDDTYQTPKTSRITYLGSGMALINPENDTLFVHSIKELIEPFNNDFMIKKQFIPLFIKYNNGANNPDPEIVLLIRANDIDYKNQSFKFHPLIKNPLVENYYEHIPGLNLEFEYSGFGSNPTWVYRGIVIASVAIFLPLVWIGIFFVLKFFGFSVKNIAETNKQKRKDKHILLSFQDAISESEENKNKYEMNSAIVEKQYGDLMLMIDKAQHNQFEDKIKIYFYESSAITKEDGDLAFKLLKTKLQLLQRYFTENGIPCYRYNLKDHRDIFLKNPKLVNHLKKTNFKLPVIMDNNDILHYGSYPNNEELSSIFGINISWLKKIDSLTIKTVDPKNVEELLRNNNQKPYQQNNNYQQQFVQQPRVQAPIPPPIRPTAPPPRAPFRRT
ncbi:arsenic metallochaperone ArsD family protein [Mycoplasma sp. E35C]|uniref:arsenic metallochaperone ArsD family protein n=1 Tax=Mycoplasma sp. E35C TaxID=2801918 RepID=UPI001CA3D0E1|nr:arsenic metallochaperone ArsD family protein [Mycoplasma sp. E35C]QZX49362.1 arsenic metallochaperone ArsD family protein [Mycoplasma sp. E35C]